MIHGILVPQAYEQVKKELNNKGSQLIEQLIKLVK